MAFMNNNNRETGSDSQEMYVVSEPRSGVELKLAPGASMFINTGNSQNQGARPYQEDSFGYSNITDSTIVSNKGMLAILGQQLCISDQLVAIADAINSGICEQYNGDGNSKAGATMVIAYIFKNRIYWITAGDSRLYCFRKGKLMQMNEDHDYKNQLYREYINEGGNFESIEMEPQKDSLVSFIGKQGLPRVDVSLRGYKIKPNDTFVLCSDGIYNAVTTDTMKEILAVNDAQTASDKIVEQVVRAGFPGQDNMTIMVIKCRNY